MTSVNQVNLFEFDDYRRFLRAYVDDAKNRNARVSLATIGRKAGISKMAVKYLIDGKRHLAESSIERMGRALALEGTELTFFRHLVLFNKARGEDERSRQFGALLKLRNAPFKDLFVNHSEVGYFRRWFYPAIAEMSYLKGFAADPTWIQPRLYFKVSRDDIGEALAYLEVHGYLRGGRRNATKVKVPTGFKSQVYRSYAIEQARLGAGALADHPKGACEVFSLTISVDEQRLQLAKTMIEAFRMQLHDALANDATCDVVTQINMQMFTLARSDQ